MNTTAIVIVAIAGTLVIVAVATLLAYRARRRQLRDRFGPEYDRAVESASSARHAEADLRGRVDLRERLQIHPLSEAQQGQYRRDWEQVQSEFVDSPSGALDRADTLVTRVMSDRGYPMQDFDTQADLISVDHPQVVQNYRHAHHVFELSRTGRVSTEEIRDAFVSYRLLFGDLLEVEGATSTAEGTATRSP